MTGGFVLVSTDRDFESLAARVPGAKVVVLRQCDYPTEVAAEVLRRNAIRVRAFYGSGERWMGLER